MKYIHNETICNCLGAIQQDRNRKLKNDKILAVDLFKRYL